MKLKRNLTLRKVGKQYMIVENMKGSANQSNVYTLNGTAGYLWEKIGNQEFDEKMLADWLCEKYDVEREMVIGDVTELIKEWQKMNLIEV